MVTPVDAILLYDTDKQCGNKCHYRGCFIIETLKKIELTNRWSRGAALASTVGIAIAVFDCLGEYN